MTRISGHSRILAIIGDPIEHSLSPAMHNAAMTSLGIDGVYVPIRTDASALPHVLRAFEAVSIAGNVTIPHKVAVSDLLIRVTSRAKELGAVNTFWPEGGRLVGDNTDVQGILDAVQPLEPRGPWLVLGTGGAARGAAVAARESGAELLVRSRDERRARDFAEWASKLEVEARADDGSPVGMAVNATPLGLRADDPDPVEVERLNGCEVALDLVYARGETGWVRRARERGLRATDGRGVLVAQGAHAFERFFPDHKAAVEVMRAKVEEMLRP
ncbi:MAG: shikimate dehydrogenase family protein [Gemmatimonadales bacterium]